MTSKERVIKAIRHEWPDRTPMHFGGTAMSQCYPEFLAKYAKFWDIHCRPIGMRTDAG